MTNNRHKSHFLIAFQGLDKNDMILEILSKMNIWSILAERKNLCNKEIIFFSVLCWLMWYEWNGSNCFCHYGLEGSLYGPNRFISFPYTIKGSRKTISTRSKQNQKAKNIVPENGILAANFLARELNEFDLHNASTLGYTKMSATKWTRSLQLNYWHHFISY